MQLPFYVRILPEYRRKFQSGSPAANGDKLEIIRISDGGYYEWGDPRLPLNYAHPYETEIV
jgi:hypothetical protein